MFILSFTKFFSKLLIFRIAANPERNPNKKKKKPTSLEVVERTGIWRCKIKNICNAGWNFILIYNRNCRNNGKYFKIFTFFITYYMTTTTSLIIAILIILLFLIHCGRLWKKEKFTQDRKVVAEITVKKLNRKAQTPPGIICWGEASS